MYIQYHTPNTGILIPKSHSTKFPTWYLFLHVGAPTLDSYSLACTPTLPPSHCATCSKHLSGQSFLTGLLETLNEWICIRHLEQCLEHSKCHISVYWMNKLNKHILIYLLSHVPLHFHLLKGCPNGLPKCRGELKRARTRAVPRACCLPLMTHLPSQPLFLSGRASYRSIPNLPVPTPMSHPVQVLHTHVIM